MWETEPASPVLTEPGVKYFIGCTLKECRRFKDQYFSVMFNVGMSIFFVVLVGGFLVYRFKGKLTPLELANKNREKKEYIFTKLHQFAAQRRKMTQDNITGLPEW
jgi:hypothetical protein